MDEISSLKRLLRKLRDNLLIVEIENADFIDSRSIPLDRKQNENRIREKIEEIEVRLAELQIEKETENRNDSRERIGSRQWGLKTIARILVEPIFNLRYERMYLNNIARSFDVLRKLYTPLEFWANPISTSDLSSGGTGESRGLLLDHINNYHRVILLGEGGSGKTTSLQRVALKYAVQASQQSFGAHSIIPVYVSLGKLNEPTYLALFNIIQDAIRAYERSSRLERYGIRLGSRVSDRIEELLEDGRIILLLDSLEEISGDIQEEALKIIDEFLYLPNYSDSQIILAARPTKLLEYIKLEKIQTLLLLPLADKAMSGLLTNRGINTETVLRRLEMIELKDICRNPGILSMFADLYESPEHDLPLTRGQVFSKYVNKLLKDGQTKWKPNYDWRWVSTDIVIDLLGRLAYDMTSRKMYRVSVDYAKDVIAGAIENGSGIEATDVIEQAVFCLLMEYSANQTEIQFKHNLLRSYFAAVELEHRFRPNKLFEIHDLLADETWWDSILLQADIVAKPVSFANHIANMEDAPVNLHLALGCLLSTTPKRATDESLDYFEETRRILEKKLIERLQTYLDIGELHDISVKFANLVGKPFVDILAKLVDPEITPLVDRRKFGVQLLSSIGGEDTIDYLISALADPDLETCQKAKQALLEISQSVDLSYTQIIRLIELIGHENVYRQATEILLSTKNEKKRQMLVDALETEPSSNTRATLRYILYKAQDTSQAIQISEFDNIEKAEKLILASIKFQNQQNKVNDEILGLLREDTQLDERRCFEPLIDLSTHQDNEIAIAAINHLKNMKDTAIFPAFSAIVIDEARSMEVRLAAAQAMSEIVPSNLQDSLPKLVQLLFDTTNWQIRNEVEKLLKNLGRDTVDYLLPYLSKKEAKSKRDAVRLLGAIGDRRVIPYFTRLAEDGDWSVRCAVAWGMGAISAPIFEEALEKLTQDRNLFVKRQAEASLEAIKEGRLSIATLKPVSEQHCLCRLFATEVDKILQQSPRPWFFMLGRMWQSKDEYVEFTIVMTNPEQFLIRRSMKFLLEQNYLLAAAEFRFVIDQNTHNYLAYLGRSHALAHANFFEDALSDCNEAIRINPKWALAYTQRAQIHLKFLRPELALFDAEIAITLDPDLIIARVFLAEANKLLAPAQAEAQYRTILEREPLEIGAHIGLAQLHILNLHLEDALVRLNTAIDLAPNYSISYLVRASLLMMFGRTDLAELDLNTAVELEPNSAELYSLRATIEWLRGNLEKALENCNRAEKIDIYNISAMYIRTLISLSQNEEDAIKQCDRILRLYPGFFYIYLIRGIARRIIGQTNLALDDFNLFVRVLPNLGFPYLLRATLFYQDDRDLAWQDINKAVELSPFSAIPRSVRGQFYQNEERLVEALQELDKAIELAPGTWLYYCERAQLRLLIGDLEAAEDDLDLAEKLWPDSPYILDTRSSLCIAQGNLKEANLLIDQVEALPYTLGKIDTVLKRNLILLCEGNEDEALRNFAEWAPKMKSTDLETALLDLKLAPNLSEEQRSRVSIILEAHYEKGIDLFGDFGYSVLLPLLPG